MYATKIERPIETVAPSNEPRVYATKIERPMETYAFSNDCTLTNQNGPRYVDDHKSLPTQDPEYIDVLESPIETFGITNTPGSGSKFGFEEAEDVKPHQQQKKTTNQEAKMKVSNDNVACCQEPGRGEKMF